MEASSRGVYLIFHLSEGGVGPVGGWNLTSEMKLVDKKKAAPAAKAAPKAAAKPAAKAAAKPAAKPAAKKK